MSDNHNGLIEEIIEHPEIISEDFKTITYEFAVGRGKVDIIGKEEDIFCIVEVKRDLNRKSLSKAKRQLKNYARQINTILKVFGNTETTFRLYLYRATEENKRELYRLKRDKMILQRRVNFKDWLDEE